MLSILKREISSYFTSPLGYVFLAVFYGFSGLFLWMNCLVQGSADMSGVFMMMFFIIVILIPVLTMRTMAEEKRQKTDQLTLTSPISLFGLIAGKFLAAFFVFMCAAVVLLIYALFIAKAVSDTGNVFAWQTFWGNFVGLILMGGVFISVGIFISCLTENQMIAAVGGIGANIALCMFDIISVYIPIDAVKNIFSALTVFGKYSEFTYGLFSFRNILFFVSIITIFLFLTSRITERRRWN